MEEGGIQEGRRVSFQSKHTDGTTKTVEFIVKPKDKKRRVYVDNARNRAANRVGQEIPMTPKMIEWTEKVRRGEIKRDEKGRIVKCN